MNATIIFPLVVLANYKLDYDGVIYERLAIVVSTLFAQKEQVSLRRLTITIDIDDGKKDKPPAVISWVRREMDILSISDDESLGKLLQGNVRLLSIVVHEKIGFRKVSLTILVIEGMVDIEVGFPNDVLDSLTVNAPIFVMPHMQNVKREEIMVTNLDFLMLVATGEGSSSAIGITARV